MIGCSALGRTPLVVHQTRAFVRQGLQRRIAVRQISRLRLCARVSESAQLHDAVHLTLAALLRRRNQVLDMSSAAKQGDVELFVLSGRGAPELDELTNLPNGVHLLGTGRPDQELKGAQQRSARDTYKLALSRIDACSSFPTGWSKADWEKVQVLLKCGTGKDASTKQELQVTSTECLQSRQQSADKAQMQLVIQLGMCCLSGPIKY